MVFGPEGTWDIGQIACSAGYAWRFQGRISGLEFQVRMLEVWAINFPPSTPALVHERHYTKPP